MEIDQILRRISYESNYFSARSDREHTKLLYEFRPEDLKAELRPIKFDAVDSNLESVSSTEEAPVEKQPKEISFVLNVERVDPTHRKVDEIDGRHLLATA